MNKLLFRKYRLSIRNRGVETLIENARIKFDITKSLFAKENTAYVSIYNIGSDIRDILTKSSSTLMLQVGYEEESNLTQIIFGDITSVSVTRSATDTVTKVQVIEGYKKLNKTIIQISLDNNPTLGSILDVVQRRTRYSIELVGLDRGVIFDKSYADIGPLDIVLDHIAQRFNFKWSLQNRTLLLVSSKPNSSVAKTILNNTSGLLLNPEAIKIFESNFTSDENERENDKKHVLALLQPNIQINDIIEVDGQDFKGNFRVTKIRHNGDSRANDWYSNIEMD